MTDSTQAQVPEKRGAEDAGRYFHYMAEFVGFGEDDIQAIRQSGLIIEKHLPAIIGRFYTNLLQYPPTRKYFLRPDGSLDEDYLQLRMYHQANFWRRTAGGNFDELYAGFVDYVGRAHTSRGADARVYIAERYVIGMVGFVQHAITEALLNELNEYDPDLAARAIKGWNKLCMVLLEMLARAYGHEREGETFAEQTTVDAQEIHAMSVQSYEKGLGLRRDFATRRVAAAQAAEIPSGERKIVAVDGLSIGIFHHGENWRAIRNHCLHRGGPVATGRIVGDSIVCPWHGYTYNLLDGRLLIDPGVKLDSYPVEIENGVIYLLIPVEAPLTSQASAETGVAAEAAPESTPSEAEMTLKPNEFKLADLPDGGVGLVEVDGQRVAVYHVGGEYFATADECTHAGGPLSEGELNGEEIVCPWHDSCFNVRTGAVTCRPATQPVKVYRVSVEDGIGRVSE